jgi:beta-galactosidase GanA
VETYVPWSVHELEAGRFDFGELDRRKDVGAFLDLAHTLGLRAIVRPGPHINAELTHFGIPERVLLDPQCQARSPRGNPVMLYFPPRMFPVPSYASEAYLAEVGRWFDAVTVQLAPRVRPLGPVEWVQIDNEAGYYFRNGPTARTSTRTRAPRSGGSCRPATARFRLPGRRTVAPTAASWTSTRRSASSRATRWACISTGRRSKSTC